MPWVQPVELATADCNELLRLVAEARAVQGFWGDVLSKAFIKALQKK